MIGTCVGLDIRSGICCAGTDPVVREMASIACPCDEDDCGDDCQEEDYDERSSRSNGGLHEVGDVVRRRRGEEEMRL